MKHQISSQESSGLPALLGSVLLHGLVVVLVVVAYTHQKPLPKTVQLEASLMTGGELEGAMTQIQEAFANHQAKTETQSANPTPQSISDKMQRYYDDLEAKERAYQKQMDAYAKTLDQEIASDMQLYANSLEEAERERQRQVAELEKRERSNEDIAAENSKELADAKQRLAENQDPNIHESKSLSDGRRLTNNDKSASVSTGGRVSGGMGSGTSLDQNTIKNALIRHIRSYWQQTGTKQTLKVFLKVDSGGNIQSLRITGGDEVVRQRLEETIWQANPLTPIVGTPYRDLTFNFNIN